MRKLILILMCLFVTSSWGDSLDISTGNYRFPGEDTTIWHRCAEFHKDGFVIWGIQDSLILPIPDKYRDATNWFAGAVYDQAFTGTAGVIFPIGGGFYNLSYLDVGNTGANVRDEAIFIMERGKFFLGVLLGAGFDVQNKVGDGQTPVSYFTSSTGTLGGYNVSEKFGIWIATRYKFDFKTDNAFESLPTIGIGVFGELNL